MTLLSVEPNESLHFSKTATSGSLNRMLKLTNTSSGNVAFKVKTTAPKSYLVRPSSGTLRPKDHQEVQIILQPQGGDVASNHRFLVQAFTVQSAEPVSREDWANIPKEQIQEQRLNVILEAGSAAPVSAASGNAVAEAEDANNGSSGKLDAADAGNASVFKTGVSAAESNSATSTAPDTPSDLKVKYDELVQYTLMLEKEKKKLEELAEGYRNNKGSASTDSGPYKTYHVVVVALIAFLLSYATKFLG